MWFVCTLFGAGCKVHVLQTQSVRHEIMRSSQESGEVLCDFSNGIIFK